MKRLDELKRYYIDFMNNKIVEDPQGLYMDSQDVETLVSELDDAFEHCKMDLESEKATVEELKNSNGWHNASEELPTHHRAVAISPEFKGCGFACYNEYDNCWDTEDGDDYLCDIDEIKYWFEIPEAPKD